MKVTEESFLKGVENHRMTIKLDNGVYRHLVFAKPGSTDMMFEIVTFPGSLCYTGDMGTFVFSRLQDMFEFFRHNINLSYWHEKLEAVDRQEGSKKYSPKAFRSIIDDIIDDEYDEGEPPEGLREDIEENILSLADTSEYEVRQAIDNYELEDFKFVDFWECDLTDYTNRYIWCCYAIVWAIERYDIATADSAHRGSP